MESIRAYDDYQMLNFPIIEKKSYFTTTQRRNLRQVSKNNSKSMIENYQDLITPQKMDDREKVIEKKYRNKKMSSNS